MCITNLTYRRLYLFIFEGPSLPINKGLLLKSMVPQLQNNAEGALLDKVDSTLKWTKKAKPDGPFLFLMVE